jgi:SAM-dependent methyltransferase
MREHQRELESIRDRYARRKQTMHADQYSYLRPENYLLVQERQRAMLRLLAAKNINALPMLRLTEVGCGSGGNLIECLQLGFSPENLVGIELLPERLRLAADRLPAKVRLVCGDATHTRIAPASQDIVFQSVVFSSILDNDVQVSLAKEMWYWTKPGGAVLWYDFIYNNPNNPDVRGVPLARVRSLFPEGCMSFRRVTLAPPIARRVVKVQPLLYTLFNCVPWLRTHVVCLIVKDSAGLRER